MKGLTTPLSCWLQVFDYLCWCIDWRLMCTSYWIDTLVLKVLRALRNLKSVELKDTMEEKIHDKLKINGLEAKVQELQHTLASTEQSSSPHDDEINKQNHTELQDMPNIGAPRNDPYASFFSVWRWCGKAKAPAQDATQKAGYACILTTYS